MNADDTGPDEPNPPKSAKRWRVHRASLHPQGKTYQDLRLQIKTGDLLLFRGDRLLSDAIERLSDSPYSHIAILAWWNDRVVAFQADLRGVEVLPASTMVCKYRGKVDWWALKPELRDNKVFAERDLFNAALTLLGIKYGYLHLLELGARILLGRTLSPTDAHATPDSLFCSQFVSRCFRAAGLDVNPDANDLSTSPADFATSGFFDPRYQLFDGSDGQACRILLEAPPGQTRTDVLAWDGERRRPSATSLADEPSASAR